MNPEENQAYEKPVFTKTRKELAEKYFHLSPEFYVAGNMGIVSLLSDVQHILANYHGGESGAHYNEILNDIKCVLVEDHKAADAVRQVVGKIKGGK